MNLFGKRWGAFFGMAGVLILLSPGAASAKKFSFKATSYFCTIEFEYEGGEGLAELDLINIGKVLFSEHTRLHENDNVAPDDTAPITKPEIVIADPRAMKLTHEWIDQVYEKTGGTALRTFKLKSGRFIYSVETLKEFRQIREDDRRKANAAAQAQDRRYQEILAALTDEDPVERNNAADELRRFNRPETVAALIKALDDPNREVRVSAARSLGHLGPNAKDALPGLQKIWAEEKTGPTLHALVNVQGKESVPLLKELVAAPLKARLAGADEYSETFTGARVLAELAAGELVKLLGDKEGGKVVRAVEMPLEEQLEAAQESALASRQRSEADARSKKVTELLEQFTAGDTEQKIEAILKMPQLDAEQRARVIAVFGKELESPSGDDDVQARIAYYFGKFGDPFGNIREQAAVPSLKAALRDSSPSVWSNAEDALRAILEDQAESVIAEAREARKNGHSPPNAATRGTEGQGRGKPPGSSDDTVSESGDDNNNGVQIEISPKKLLKGFGF